MSYIVRRSTRPDKKYMVITPDGTTIHYGASGSKTFLDHNDKRKKSNYIKRHQRREDWTKSGIDTAGFWSKHYSWNKPIKKESVRDIQRSFNIRVIDKTI